jgi:uncharacterized metal-binding protein YceD (DUF177 family)
MKIHLRQIPPEGSHLEGEEDCLIPELESEGIRCLGPMSYSVDVGISDGSLWVNGVLKQKVELTCVACLEQFAYEIAVPSFAIHTELLGPEVVDLTPFMREDILLNLPPHPRCDREGGRVCREARPKYSNLEEQEREAKREHDWEALDKLKLKR